jgi:hypothetical protein
MAGEREDGGGEGVEGETRRWGEINTIKLLIPNS